MTPVSAPLYSGGMISDFHTLADKIERLADMASALRRENADLRLRASALEAENSALAARMAQAHERVTALLDKLPASEVEADEEAA